MFCQNVKDFVVCSGVIK